MTRAEASRTLAVSVGWGLVDLAVVGVFCAAASTVGDHLLHSADSGSIGKVAPAACVLPRATDLRTLVPAPAPSPTTPSPSPSSWFPATEPTEPTEPTTTSAGTAGPGPDPRQGGTS